MKCTKEASVNQKKIQMKYKLHIYIILFFILIFLSSCQLFQREDNDKIDIPTQLSEKQLEEVRYKFKHDKATKTKYLYQNKSDSIIVTLYNIITYNIRDEQGTNIGEGFNYYIFDIGVDNPTDKPFDIAAFSKSCRLTNSNPQYLYSNVGFALKMYYLQSDSSEIDMEYLKRFYQKEMPPKEVFRTKLLAFEVSKDDKNPLFFRYEIGNKQFAFKVRD